MNVKHKHLQNLTSSPLLSLLSPCALQHTTCSKIVFLFYVPHTYIGLWFCFMFNTLMLYRISIHSNKDALDEEKVSPIAQE